MNLLLFKFSKCRHDVLLYLFRSFCMSFYGSQLLDYSCTNMVEKLFIAYLKCVRRILKLPYQTHCDILNVLMNNVSIDCILQKRFRKFFLVSCRSQNSVVAFLSKVVINGSMSKTCNSLNLICSMYNICKMDLSLSDLSKVTNDIGSDMLMCG